MEVKGKLDFSEKHKTSYCIPSDIRDVQILTNIKKVKERIQQEELKDEPIAIVGFGGSLNDTWEEIGKFKNIFTCSGAHKFLLDKGFKSTDFKRWMHNDLDPRPHKVKLLGDPQDGIEYYAASTIHPNYIDKLNSFDLKLWHIFANEDDGFRILPHGEFLFTGGSDVGMRTLVLARFLGYREFHVFGFDGSVHKVSGFHAAEHPNKPPHCFEVEINDKTFLTTPALLECAKQLPREIDELSDVTTKFYGEGIAQEIMRDYKRKANYKSGYLWMNKERLISDEYINLNAELHERNTSYGTGGAKHAETVKKLVKTLITEDNPIPSVLDYGAGKQFLAKALPFPIWSYDPAIPEISEIPKPADLTICTDVLEHIEPDKLNFVLQDLKRCVKQIGYFVISTRQAVKTYANGKNTHLIVKDRNWWEKMLSKYFSIPPNGITEKKDVSELHIVVAPKLTEEKIKEDITEVNGIKFHTPNELTKWRANTLLTKEPCTIEWLNGMKKDAVFFDVGACVGSYSMIAAKNGMQVYSFEPEPENFALLEKNFELNGFNPSAFCIAASDEKKVSNLYVTKGGAGQSFHQFGEGESKIKKMCMGVPLDDFLEMGLPHPDYLKIDVDGFEPKVIKGAEKILQNGLTSLLVEVDTNNEEHKKMVEHICSLGYEYDEKQVDKAMRKEGTFKGVAEYIFKKIKMPTKDRITGEVVEDFLFIKKAEMIDYPFNYLYINGFFSPTTYSKLVNNFPEKYEPIEKTRGTKGYPKRFTATLDNGYWKDVSDVLLDGKFKKVLLDKFNIKGDGFTEDLLLVRDYEGYQIPPHTDSLRKVITVLLYLPEDNSIEHEGTSIYVPKEKGFTCDKGIHYNFDDFEKVWTAPFKPNSALIFARTNNSFHGVEPTNSQVERNVLLYNINKK
jgi:FkbM family methyltransferase